MRPKNLGYLSLVLIVAFVAMCQASCCAPNPAPTQPLPQTRQTNSPGSLFSLLFGNYRPVCVPEGHRVMVPSAGGWAEVCPCPEPSAEPEARSAPTMMLPVEVVPMRIRMQPECIPASEPADG